MITYSAPASRTICPLTSPVNAPSRSQCRSCAGHDHVAVARGFGHGVHGGERRRDHDLDVGDVLDEAAELFDVLHGVGHRLVHLPVARDDRGPHGPADGLRLYSPSREFQRSSFLGQRRPRPAGAARPAARATRLRQSRCGRCVPASPALFTAAMESPPPTMLMPLHAGHGLRHAPSCPARTRRFRTRPSGRSTPPFSRLEAHRRRRATVAGPISRPMRSPIAGVVHADRFRGSPGLELRRHHVVGRQQQRQAARGRARQDLARRVQLVVFDQRLADGFAHRLEERVGHGAADEQAVDARHQVVDHLDLVRHLGPAQHGHERALRGRSARPPGSAARSPSAGRHRPRASGAPAPPRWRGRDARRRRRRSRRRRPALPARARTRRRSSLPRGGSAGSRAGRRRRPGRSFTAFCAGAPDAVVREGDRPCRAARARRSATGFRLMSGFGLPLGRPRCEASTTHRAPASSACLIVGSDARMRVSSPMTPPFSGTLKSTRMKTRSPLRSRSRMVRLATNSVPHRGPGAWSLEPDGCGYRPLAASFRSKSTQRFE